MTFPVPCFILLSFMKSNQGADCHETEFPHRLGIPVSLFKTPLSSVLSLGWAFGMLRWRHRKGLSAGLSRHLVRARALRERDAVGFDSLEKHDISRLGGNTSRGGCGGRRSFQTRYAVGNV